MKISDLTDGMRVEFKQWKFDQNRVDTGKPTIWEFGTIQFYGVEFSITPDNGGFVPPYMEKDYFDGLLNKSSKFHKKNRKKA